RVESRGITFCPAGTCAGGSQGHTKTPGVDLFAPAGAYPATGSGASPGPWQWDLPPNGHILFVSGGAVPDGGAEALAGRVFRMPHDEPFGDSWYCIGEGSTFTSSGAGRVVSFRNITRLGSGSGKGDTASVTLIGNHAVVGSTVRALVATS